MRSLCHEDSDKDVRRRMLDRIQSCWRPASWWPARPHPSTTPRPFWPSFTAPCLLRGVPLDHLGPVKGAGVRQPFSPQGHTDALIVEVGVYARVADGRGREHARRLEHFVVAQVGWWADG